MKKIHIIGTVGLPANYGGWETLSDNLVKHLAKDYEITVYCTSTRYSEKIDEYNGAKLVYLKLNANGFQSIFYDLLSMIKSIRTSDVMLVLGVSGCIFLPFIKLLYKGRVIVNIDGMEWRRDKWSKYTKKFLKLSEYVAVKFADIVVSDNKAIQNYIYEEYQEKSELIAYGADHAYTDFVSEKLSKSELDSFSCFKVCRIEPENNIEMILNAFVLMPRNSLIIVGNWENSEYGKTLKTKFNFYKNIQLLNPIYNILELNKLRCNADIYMHGHSAGGTNPSLVEAMFLALPIFSYDVSYNRETTLNQCEYFKNTDELIDLFKKTNREKLIKNAIDMKKIADNIYTWSAVSKNYKKLLDY